MTTVITLIRDPGVQKISAFWVCNFLVNQVCGVNLMDGDVIVSGADGTPAPKRNQSMTSRRQNQAPERLYSWNSFEESQPIKQWWFGQRLPRWLWMPCLVPESSTWEAAWLKQLRGITTDKKRSFGRQSPRGPWMACLVPCDWGQNCAGETRPLMSPIYLK